MDREFKSWIRRAGAADEVARWRADKDLASAVDQIGGHDLTIEEDQGALSITYIAPAESEHHAADAADKLGERFLSPRYSHGANLWLPGPLRAVE